MHINFDDIFHKPEVDWTKEKLVKNSPCRKCKHQILLKKQHPGNNCYPPIECSGCKQRIDWIVRCLYKLEWYEKQEEAKCTNLEK